MNRHLILRKPNNLSLQLIDHYSEMEFDIENQKLEKDISYQIESLNNAILIAYYDGFAFKSQEIENDIYRINQSLID